MLTVKAGPVKRRVQRRDVVGDASAILAPKGAIHAKEELRQDRPGIQLRQLRVYADARRNARTDWTVGQIRSESGRSGFNYLSDGSKQVE
jgi:hypothetical protein